MFLLAYLYLWEALCGLVGVERGKTYNNNNSNKFRTSMHVWLKVQIGGSETLHMVYY